MEGRVKPKWLPHLQHRLFHQFVNQRWNLDRIAKNHDRPLNEIADQLQHMDVMNKFGERIGKAAKTEEEKQNPRVHGVFTPREERTE